MRKNISLALTLLAVIAVATLLLDYSMGPQLHDVKEASTPAETVAAQPAPDFKFTDTNNKNHSLENFRGQPVILHFWASWCAPCVRELPKLALAAASHKGVVFIALSSDESVSSMRRFIEKAGLENKSINLHFAWDKGRGITHDLYQTFAYPETIIIDATGNMVRKIPGDADWTGQEMSRYLDSLAKSPAKP